MLQVTSGLHLNMRITFPLVDAVILFGGSSDDQVLCMEREETWKKVKNPAIHCFDANTPNRFRSSLQEILFSLQLLDKNLPWLNTVWLVMSRPPNIDLLSAHPKLKLILHHEFFRDPSDLPSFNSNSIENELAQIAELEQHFLVLNDDFLVAKRMEITDFFLLSESGTAFPKLVPKVHLDSGWARYGQNNVETSGFRNMWMNVNRILDNKYHPTRRHKLSHSPYPMTKQLLDEAWADPLLQPTLELTSASHFRSINDINLVCAYIPSKLLHTGQTELATYRSTTIYLTNDRPKVLEQINRCRGNLPDTIALEDDLEQGDEHIELVATQLMIELLVA